ncbi:LysR family transcriptional regulator [Microbulbifer spongiae]|uniref:LysR family transcriptional regulator n=1 Tax=Microbulbifer spongiae TaxID=2944933 RepID=A0ABY9E940_9GAMM|nr:LysR family transcriptional regulator [Microbulbifer sp. MI-G]WKD49528.1 LysR family transcriptional regulator [Microbulbifer sp. MI-G]
MEKWTELRTAYKLAKLGTLSATAQAIGVHRSTVMRHIDALEESLGIVLFQRNDKGYLPTEAGLEIMRLGEVTDNQFNNLSDRLQSREKPLQGTLTITMVNEVASVLMPTINQYQAQHPGMRMNIIGDLRNFKLEYGEADIAIRGGPKPETPDNIVLPLTTVEIVLCAHKSYIKKHGHPAKANLQKHRFIALNERPIHLPWNDWIYSNVDEERIILTTSATQILSHALFSGIGIGGMPKTLVTANRELVEIPVGEDWKLSLWTLVHRDMINMPKIRTFIDLLKQQTDWEINPL